MTTRRTRSVIASGRPLSTRIGLLIVAGLLTGCAVTGSAPAPRSVFRAVLISDLNASYGSTHYPAEVGNAIAHITDTWRPDVVLIAGDMVAGQSPQLPDSIVWAMWAAFDSVVAAPLRSAGIALIATMGNHDASAYPAHARDRRIAAEHWRASPHRSQLPRLVHGDHYPLRYAVRYPDVFIVAWDATNQESTTSEELLNWLHGVLTSHEARQARHRVVLAHLPLYGVAEGRDRPGEVLSHGDEVRRQIESWGATLFVSGHHHAYYPGRRDALDLLHAGALGEGPRVLLGTGMAATKTVSILDFHADSLSITTYRMEGGTDVSEPVATESLPAIICSSRGWVMRRDVAAVDTSCAAPR